MSTVSEPLPLTGCADLAQDRPGCFSPIVVLADRSCAKSAQRLTRKDTEMKRSSLCLPPGSVISVVDFSLEPYG